MKKMLHIAMCMLSICTLKSQVNFSSNYSQNFGNVDITSWTNNVTFTGWYYSCCTMTHQDVLTAPVPSNTGGLYSYECNSDNNQKIGTRPSNTSPGAVGTFMRYGVILTNTSTQTIDYLQVSFDAYQFSLAGNGSVINTLDFHYCVGNPVNTNLTTGTYNAVAALTFTAPQSTASTSSSPQLAGYPCTETQFMTACFNIPGGVPPGSQVCLRWSDQNNSNNDPHLGIDNIAIVGYENNSFNLSNNCISPLPVELVSFDLECKQNRIDATWTTSSEINNDHFSIQGSNDALEYKEMKTLAGNGNSNTLQMYETSFLNVEGFTYFRLAQIDHDGFTTYYDPIYLNCKNTSASFSCYYNNPFIQLNLPQDLSELSEINLINQMGEILYSTTLHSLPDQKIELSNSLPIGVYYILLIEPQTGKTYNCKMLTNQ